jgi:hypothetical protein
MNISAPYCAFYIYVQIEIIRGAIPAPAIFGMIKAWQSKRKVEE